MKDKDQNKLTQLYLENISNYTPELQQDFETPDDDQDLKDMVSDNFINEVMTNLSRSEKISLLFMYLDEESNLYKFVDYLKDKSPISKTTAYDNLKSGNQKIKSMCQRILLHQNRSKDPKERDKLRVFTGIKLTKKLLGWAMQNEKSLVDFIGTNNIRNFYSKLD
jgi:hypothetical protein